VSPVIPSNTYGKGRAIYVGLPAGGEVLGALLDDLTGELGSKRGPKVPDGVMARQKDENHFLYLNVSGEPREIHLKEKSRSVLYDKDYAGNFVIAPFEPDFIEIK
jgi:beta-galactosidase